MSDAALTLSVVITNYNGERYLPGMIAALRRSTTPPLEIIVSDDLSTDGGLLWLRHNAPEVSVIRGDRNGGPAPARNAGIRAARGDLVLLLDNDAHPEKDAITALLARFAQDPGLVAVSPRSMMASEGDGPEIVHYDGGWTHPTGQMWLQTSHVPLREAPREPEAVASMVGTVMCFRREAALAIGGFEPSYFFYYEDHDFGTRMRLTGGRMSSCPAARVRHLGGTATLSFRVGQRYPEKRRYLIPRNRMLFVLRTLQGPTLRALAPLLLLHELAQAVFVLVRGWHEPWAAGLHWNLTNLGRTLRQRDRVQGLRRAPDAAILRGGRIPLHPGLLEKRGLAARAVRLLDRALGGWWRLVRPSVLAAGSRWCRERDLPPRSSEPRR